MDLALKIGRVVHWETLPLKQVVLRVPPEGKPETLKRDLITSFQLLFLTSVSAWGWWAVLP